MAAVDSWRVKKHAPWRLMGYVEAVIGGLINNRVFSLQEKRRQPAIIVVQFNRLLTQYGSDFSPRLQINPFCIYHSKILQGHEKPF